MNTVGWVVDSLDRPFCYVHHVASLVSKQSLDISYSETASLSVFYSCQLERKETRPLFSLVLTALYDE